jgi:hypothetical protein
MSDLYRHANTEDSMAVRAWIVPVEIGYPLERLNEAVDLIGDSISALSEARTALGDAIQGIGGDDG